MLLNARQHRSNGFVAGDIEFHASALNTVFFQGGSNTLGTGSRSRGADDHGALTTQLQRDSLTNATASARYQCNFTLQAHAGFS